MKEKSVWTKHVSQVKARQVARALKEAGYAAKIDECYGYVINIARYFEPSDATARENVLRIVCEAAGIQPRREIA